MAQFADSLVLVINSNMELLKLVFQDKVFLNEVTLHVEVVAAVIILTGIILLLIIALLYYNGKLIIK